MELEALGQLIASAQSLDEIETRLRSQQGVVSVQLADYLMKSYPPQRDFVVELERDDGSTEKKVVNVYDLGTGHFRFNKVRDE